MSVLTGIETESAFMENLRERRREMVDMTGTNLRGYRAGLSLDAENRPPSFLMPTGEKSSRRGSRITHGLCSTLLLLDCLVADQKHEEVIDIWRISV